MKELDQIFYQKGFFFFNKRAPFFDKRALGQSRKTGKD